MMGFTLPGRINDLGEMKIDGAAFRRLMAKIPGREVLVSVSLNLENMVDSHRSYYFSVVLPHVCTALLEHGHETDRDTVHEYLKRRFGIKTTKGMKEAHWRKYIDSIHRFSAEALHYFIPSKTKTFHFRTTAYDLELFEGIRRNQSTQC